MPRKKKIEEAVEAATAPQEFHDVTPEHEMDFVFMVALCKVHLQASTYLNGMQLKDLEVGTGGVSSIRLSLQSGVLLVRFENSPVRHYLAPARWETAE